MPRTISQDEWDKLSIQLNSFESWLYSDKTEGKFNLPEVPGEEKEKSKLTPVIFDPKEHADWQKKVKKLLYEDFALDSLDEEQKKQLVVMLANVFSKMERTVPDFAIDDKSEVIQDVEKEIKKIFAKIIDDDLMKKVKDTMHVLKPEKEFGPQAVWPLIEKYKPLSEIVVQPLSEIPKKIVDKPAQALFSVSHASGQTAFRLPTDLKKKTAMKEKAAFDALKDMDRILDQINAEKGRGQRSFLSRAVDDLFVSVDEEFAKLTASQEMPKEQKITYYFTQLNRGLSVANDENTVNAMYKVYAKLLMLRSLLRLSDFLTLEKLTAEEKKNYQAISAPSLLILDIAIYQEINTKFSEYVKKVIEQKQRSNMEVVKPEKKEPRSDKSEENSPGVLLPKRGAAIQAAIFKLQEPKEEIKIKKVPQKPTRPEKIRKINVEFLQNSPQESRQVFHDFEKTLNDFNQWIDKGGARLMGLPFANDEKISNAIVNPLEYQKWCDKVRAFFNKQELNNKQLLDEKEQVFATRMLANCFLKIIGTIQYHENEQAKAKEILTNLFPDNKKLVEDVTDMMYILKAQHTGIHRVVSEISNHQPDEIETRSREGKKVPDLVWSQKVKENIQALERIIFNAEHGTEDKSFLTHLTEGLVDQLKESIFKDLSLPKGKLTDEIMSEYIKYVNANPNAFYLERCTIMMVRELVKASALLKLTDFSEKDLKLYERLYGIVPT